MFEDAQMIPCDDAAIAVYCYGRGRPLVLLHGNGEDSSYFKAQIEAFSRFYQVIAVDSRGHGQSEMGQQPLTFSLMADDLHTVLQTLGVRRAVILGFSDGGNLAIKFALRYPECVERLILNGANVNMLTGVKLRYQLPLYPAYGVLRLLAKTGRRLAHRRDVLGLMVHSYGVTMEDLRRITVPTLVVVGEHDMITSKQTEAMVSHLPHSTLSVLRDGDHFCAAKQPARFNRIVMEFLMGETDTI